MTQYRQSDAIDFVLNQIVEKIHPRQVILYNQRLNPQEQTYSFKLCIVAPAEDADRTLKELYLGVDCAVPFDLLLYTPEEWEALTAQSSSFASRIVAMGQVLYG